MTAAVCMDPSHGVTAPSRRLALTLLFLCVAGVAVSIELTRIHRFVHTDPSYHSVCAMSERVNCETVAISPYSAFAGLPVSVWGIAAYLLLGVLAGWAQSSRRLHSAWPWGLLVTLAGVSVSVSAGLAFISVTRIDSLCLFCMGSYAINLALLVLGLVAVRRTGSRMTQLLRLDLAALRRRPRFAAAGLLAVAAALVVAEVLVPPYWQAPGWADLPALASGVDERGHHWIGSSEAKLTIVEFSDYECPHCRAAHKNMRLLAATYPDQIRLVHRHFPLDMACHPGLGRPFHAHACRFAEAAECAGLQGRFWEMNDALFSVQETVRTANVDPAELAVRLGLNRSAFVQCLETHATAARVTADLGDGLARELAGTPSFIVGERVFLGSIPEAELARLLPGAS